VTDEFERLEEAWAAAVEANDGEAADAILADDFVLTSSGGLGRWVDRDEWLANLSGIETHSLGVSEVESRVLGDVAVVKLGLRWEARMGERDLTGDYAIVDIFTRSEGAWQASWRVSQRLTES
jgi:ketosteroid isomerase-like protein